jgi:hypothetical protein
MLSLMQILTNILVNFTGANIVKVRKIIPSCNEENIHMPTKISKNVEQPKIWLKNIVSLVNPKGKFKYVSTLITTII